MVASSPRRHPELHHGGTTVSASTYTSNLTPADGHPVQFRSGPVRRGAYGAAGSPGVAGQAPVLRDTGGLAAQRPAVRGHPADPWIVVGAHRDHEVYLAGGHDRAQPVDARRRERPREPADRQHLLAADVDD